MSCLHNRDQILEFLRKFFLKGFHIYQNYLCVLEYRLVLIYSFLRFSGRSLEPRTCPTKAKVSLNRNPKGGGVFPYDNLAIDHTIPLKICIKVETNISTLYVTIFSIFIFIYFIMKLFYFIQRYIFCL